jgi:nitronate monooxygenase
LIAMPIYEMGRQAGRKDIAPGIAGQSVGFTEKIRPASEIVDEMVAEAIEVLAQGFPTMVQFSA